MSTPCPYRRAVPPRDDLDAHPGSPPVSHRGLLTVPL